MPAWAHPTPLCAADIKRRATSNYLLCTAGNGQLFLWSLNPITGELASVKVSTSSYTREYTCMQFSADREWLYAGTTTGDFACISVRRAWAACRIYEAGGNTRRSSTFECVAMGCDSHARLVPGMSRASAADQEPFAAHVCICLQRRCAVHDQPRQQPAGGCWRRRQRHVVRGRGQGMWANYRISLQPDIRRADEVAACLWVGRCVLIQEWLDEAKVPVEGSAYNVSASSDGGEVLVGTAAGFIYRVKLGARGARPTVLPVCESHASAAASLEEGLGKASALPPPTRVVNPVVRATRCHAPAHPALPPAHAPRDHCVRHQRDVGVASDHSRGWCGGHRVPEQGERQVRDGGHRQHGAHLGRVGLLGTRQVLREERRAPQLHCLLAGRAAVWLGGRPDPMPQRRHRRAVVVGRGRTPRRRDGAEDEQQPAVRGAWRERRWGGRGAVGAAPTNATVAFVCLRAVRVTDTCCWCDPACGS